MYWLRPKCPRDYVAHTCGFQQHLTAHEPQTSKALRTGAGQVMDLSTEGSISSSSAGAALEDSGGGRGDE